MTKYIYEKWSLKDQYTYDVYRSNRVYDGPKILVRDETIISDGALSLTTSYSFNRYTGMFWVYNNAKYPDERSIEHGYLTMPDLVGSYPYRTEYYDKYLAEYTVLEYGRTYEDRYKYNRKIYEASEPQYIRGAFLEQQIFNTKQSTNSTYYYQLKSADKAKNTLIEEITAEDGTYPDDGVQGNYWYVKKGIANQAPRISRGNQDLGNKSSAFSESFKLYDDNLNDSLTLTVTLISSDGTRTQILKVNNALRDNLYTAEVTDTQLKTLPLNARHTINISVTDGTETQNTNLTFTRSNSLPTVKVANANMGEQNREFSFKFTPDDADGDDITAKVYLDGIQIADLGSVARGKEITHTIKRSDFITLKNGEHKIKIDVTDSNGGISSGYIDFTKRVTWYTYEFTQETEEMASEIRIDMLAELKAGVKVDVQVCNNALDTKPTWEKAEEGKWKRIDNTTKTANKWAVGVKVHVDRGTAIEDSYIYGWNVSFA